MCIKKIYTDDSLCVCKCQTIFPSCVWWKDAINALKRSCCISRYEVSDVYRGDICVPAIRACVGMCARQQVWTNVSTWVMQAPVKATMTATTLTVSWNCKNLDMLSYTFRPHITALTMLLKLSSVRIMSDASLATSVPAMPWQRLRQSERETTHDMIHASTRAFKSLQSGTVSVSCCCAFKLHHSACERSDQKQTFKETPCLYGFYVHVYLLWNVSTQHTNVNNLSGYHGKAHISFLQSWPVISAIPCNCDNLPLLQNGAIDDPWAQNSKTLACACESMQRSGIPKLTFNQSVLVSRRGSSQNSQLGPDSIDAFLFDLWDGRENEMKVRKQ